MPNFSPVSWYFSEFSRLSTQAGIFLGLKSFSITSGTSTFSSTPCSF